MLTPQLKTLPDAWWLTGDLEMTAKLGCATDQPNVLGACTNFAVQESHRSVSWQVNMMCQVRFNSLLGMQGVIKGCWLGLEQRWPIPGLGALQWSGQYQSQDW